MNEYENTITTTGDVIVAELVETGTVTATPAMPAGTDVAPFGLTPTSLAQLATVPAGTALAPRPSSPPPADLFTSLRPTAITTGDRPERVRLRAGVGDWASLVLAVIAPPIGLVLSIVVRVVSWRRTGWTSGVVRTATVLGAVFTIIATLAGLVLSSIASDAAAEAKIAADSAPLCASLAETPGVLDAPAFGWPTETGTIAETLVAMKAYQERWQGLADVAPAEIRAGVNSVANAATTLVTTVETNKSIDRAGNLEQMSRITGGSGIPAFVGVYCG